MSTRVDIDKLVAAIFWASFPGCSAYINKQTGEIKLFGEAIDAEAPDNILDESLYVEVPQKQEFDLGSTQALRFTETHLPEAFEDVSDLLRKRCGFARFKGLLARAGKLNQWHDYVLSALATAARDWAQQKGFTGVETPPVSD